MTAGQPGQAKTLQPAVMMAVPAREAPTAATVQQAVQEARSQKASRARRPAKMSRWWHWHWNFPVFC